MPRPRAASHVQRSRDPRKRPNRKTKMGWAPIISAMSALVVSLAAWPSSRKGTTCPISASARSLAHSPGRDPGHTLPESALVSSIAAAATPTRARANSRGSKAREAILISRKDEPQRNDRKASPAYAAMEFSRFERRELGGSARGRQRKFRPAGIASAMSTVSIGGLGGLARGSSRRGGWAKRLPCRFRVSVGSVRCASSARARAPIVGPASDRSPSIDVRSFMRSATI